MTRPAFLAALIALCVLGACLSATAAEPPSSARTRALAIVEGMETAEVVVADGENAPRPLAVRVADSPRERRQGMQHLSRETVAANPMWFAFDPPRTAGWHMRNVAVALDIVFVGANGRVIAVQRMEPDGRIYGIDQPIAAALELAAGEARRLGIAPGDRLRLTATAEP